MCEGVCISPSISVITYLVFSHLNTGTSHPEQEINTYHQTNTSLQGQKSKGRMNSTLKPGRPQLEHVRKKKKKDREIQHKWKNKVETHKTK